MKLKKQSAKLRLAKRVITVLAPSALRQIKGGNDVINGISIASTCPLKK